MLEYSVFYYRTQCPLCPVAAIAVGEFFAELNQPILYRKITSDLYRIVPGLPAILVRTHVFNTKQELIIVGSRMLEQLEELKRHKLYIDHE